MFPQLIAVFLIFSNVADCLDTVENIVNGVPVNVSEVPYQVALKIGNYMCGGSIIDLKFILTAAHCTFRKDPKTIYFAVGLTDYRNYNYYKPIKNLFQHPNFNQNTVENDISLLEVNYISDLFPIRRSFTQIIPISDRTPYSGASAVVSGYGTIKSGGQISYILGKADVKIYSSYKCNIQYGGGLPQNTICAGEIVGDIVKDSCQGDSGGPLVSNDKLVGIISFGRGCADKDFPGVYTDVAKYFTWIRNTIYFATI